MLNCEHTGLSVREIERAPLLGMITLLKQQVHNDDGKEPLYVVAPERGPFIYVSNANSD